MGTSFPCKYAVSPHIPYIFNRFCDGRAGIEPALCVRVEDMAEPPPGESEADPLRGVRSVLLDQAAALLGVSRRTVYYRIREGRLRTIRTRCGSQRVLLDSVEELLRDELRKRARRKAR